MKPATKMFVGRMVERVRRVVLLQRAAREHRDAAAQRHRLDLVVGDVDGGDAEARVQPAELGPQLHPQLGVEIGERLVEQEGLRVADDGAAHGDALALAAGELAAACGRGVRVRSRMRAASLTRSSISALREFAQLQREGDILADRHLRIKRVVLEHHGDIAVARRHVVHRPCR